MRVPVLVPFLLFTLPVAAQDLSQQMVMQQQTQLATQQGQEAAQEATQIGEQANEQAMNEAQYGWTSRPGFSLKGGTYQKGLWIRIHDETPGARIYYTIDGSTPTRHSTVYAKPVLVETTTMLRAIAIAPHREGSLERAAQYRIAIKAKAAPVKP